MPYTPPMLQTTPTGKPQEFLDQLQANRTGQNRPPVSLLLDQIRQGSQPDQSNPLDIKRPEMPAWLSSNYDKPAPEKPFDSSNYLNTLNQVKGFSDTANEATQNAINFKNAYAANLAALKKAGMTDAAAKAKLGTAPPGMAGATNVPNGTGSDLTSDPQRAAAIDAGESLIGTDYVYGGGHGSKPGPSSSALRHGSANYGVDCSGLVRYAFAKAGISQFADSATAATQMSYGTRTSISNLLPGDLVGRGSPAHHIAIYLGGGKVLEAQHTGTKVHIRSISGEGGWWGIHLHY